jgi:hypothetical protein
MTDGAIPVVRVTRRRAVTVRRAQDAAASIAPLAPLTVVQVTAGVPGAQGQPGPGTLTGDLDLGTFN